MGGFDDELRVLVGSGTTQPTSFRHANRPFVVTWATNSDDDVTSLTLSTSYDLAAQVKPRGFRDGGALVAIRPLAIHLREEDAADVAAKLEGLSAEWQSGDTEFDARVYVSGPTRDPRVLGAVLGPDARRAVLELFELGFAHVDIDSARGSVDACMLAGQFASDVVGRVPKALAAFDRLLSQLPVITRSGEARPRPPMRTSSKLLGVIGALGWALNVGYVGLLEALVHAIRGEAGGVSPAALVAVLVLAVVVGLLGARAYGKALARRVRGAADAHRQVSSATIAAFAGLSVIAFAALYLLAAFIGTPLVAHQP